MNRALSLLAVLLGLAILPARAAITLHIDTTAEQIYFSGTDTGTPFASGPPEDRQYIVDWTGDVPNGGTADLLSISSAFNTASGFITNAYFLFQSEGYYGIAIGLSGDGSNTLTANSAVRIDYGELAPWIVDIFTDLAANPRPLTINPSTTGYSDLAVETVPEPGTITLAALGLSLLAHRLLRRRR